jgi:glycosyltransferase involved in cell wall biosynthesis
MKILLYSECFFPIPGGVQSYVFELACGLSEWHRDHGESGLLQVTVVTRTGESTADRSWPFGLVRCPDFVSLFQLLRDADVIHVAGPALLPMMIGVFLRKPVVVGHHAYQSICPNGILLFGPDHRPCPGHFMASHYSECLRCNSQEMGWLRSFRALVLQFPRRWLCRVVSSNIAITNHVARRVALPRTRTIGHGIRDLGPTGLAPNGNEVQIGYVGRLVHQKGLLLLVEAAKRLKDDGFQFHLTFVGGGPLREQLDSKSREMGIAGHVTFTGDLAGEDLERAVRPIQIVVMPSVWEETAGLAAIEQMMRGGVVIAADIGGLSEVVGDTGLKFVAGDSEALYLRLRQVLADPSLAASLGSSARIRAVQAFNRDNMVQAHISLYREAMNRQ